jgi:quinol monooxygenase YgiN
LVVRIVAKPGREAWRREAWRREAWTGSLETRSLDAKPGDAKPGKEETVASFLSGAESLARAEDFTPAWFALRTEPRTFYMVDAFADEEDRTKHLFGEIAKRCSRTPMSCYLRLPG